MNMNVMEALFQDLPAFLNRPLLWKTNLTKQIFISKLAFLLCNEC